LKIDEGFRPETAQEDDLLADPIASAMKVLA
jgi:hypothetical protein